MRARGHGGKEMQLINRVYRIGQERSVSIKRFVAEGTIEERMLHLRKRSTGLLASVDDADTMAVSQVTDEQSQPAKAAAAEQKTTERDEDLRYLYGFATPAETLRNEQEAALRTAAARAAARTDADDGVLDLD